MSLERGQPSAPRRGAHRTVSAPAALLMLLVAGGLPTPPKPAAAVKRMTLVVCAPGYPGTTAEAQPAMDALASGAAAAAGWAPGELGAVYFETEKGGLDRLAAPDAALALVPLPFFLEHGGALKLDPQLQAVQQGGDPAERWSLVVPRGAVTTAASLAGFEIISLAGYSPRFVRGPALGSWGELPPDIIITFSSAVLTGLRRASAGGKVALLLDREQAAAIPTLTFAAKLEVVARSAPLPVSVLCVVTGRMPAGRLRALVKGFTSVGLTPAGAEALAGVRLSRFITADLTAMARARDAFERARD